ETGGAAAASAPSTAACRRRRGTYERRRPPPTRPEPPNPRVALSASPVGGRGEVATPKPRPSDRRSHRRRGARRPNSVARRRPSRRPRRHSQNQTVLVTSHWQPSTMAYITARYISSDFDKLSFVRLRSTASHRRRMSLA